MTAGNGLDLRPETRHLLHFVVLADELNFTRAAKRLNLAQQTLSASISQLERLIGVQLVRRTTRSVEITEAGIGFRGAALTALGDIDEAMRAARAADAGEVGTLRLGIGSASGLPAVLVLLDRLAAERPQLDVTVRHYDFRDPSAGLASRDSDVAVIRPPVSMVELRTVAIQEERRCAVLRRDHPFADRDELPFSVIANDPWMYVDTDPEWCAFWRCDEYRTAPPPVGRICESVDDLIAAAGAGQAMGLVPASVAASRTPPQTAFVPVADIAPTTAAVAARADDSRAIVERLLGMAAEIAADSDS